ncbi:hypothetical protein K435DRAFT_109073 [Dendrothele bispora CBS 962.96]|uniref:Uncharacterized protein n=1 Tax=Dendrothele bispora (strain CBS 962.96) TaxID=1314807 RepID=A0A4S8M1W0_DENBC|nr:hypothetical protein K435DRAFT_109073 [Dendrothele bispora CBS 962.96]
MSVALFHLSFTLFSSIDHPTETVLEDTLLSCQTALFLWRTESKVSFPCFPDQQTRCCFKNRGIAPSQQTLIG